MAKYKKENDPSNADAIPLYVSNFLRFWDWFDNVWSCNDWVTWHKAMKIKYGKPKADATFLTYWDDLGLITSTQDCRSLNTAFRDYMKQENLLNALYSGVGIIAKPIGVGTDVISSTGGAISNVFKGVEGATKVLKIAIPLMLVAAIAVGGIWAYNKYLKK